jgi:hypothetical protein
MMGGFNPIQIHVLLRFSSYFVKIMFHFEVMDFIWNEYDAGVFGARNCKD